MSKLWLSGVLSARFLCCRLCIPYCDKSNTRYSLILVVFFERDIPESEKSEVALYLLQLVIIDSMLLRSNRVS